MVGPNELLVPRAAWLRVIELASQEGPMVATSIAVRITSSWVNRSNSSSSTRSPFGVCGLFGVYDALSHSILIVSGRSPTAVTLSHLLIPNPGIPHVRLALGPV